MTFRISRETIVNNGVEIPVSESVSWDSSSDWLEVTSFGDVHRQFIPTHQKPSTILIAQRKCAYCGNTSGTRDRRGGCVSCGAPLE